MQAARCSHVQSIEFGLVGIQVCQVRRSECLLLQPEVLPLGLDFPEVVALATLPWHWSAVCGPDLLRGKRLPGYGCSCCLLPLPLLLLPGLAV